MKKKKTEKSKKHTGNEIIFRKKGLNDVEKTKIKEKQRIVGKNNNFQIKREK